jgi:hypothetical protein
MGATSSQPQSWRPFTVHLWLNFTARLNVPGDREGPVRRLLYMTGSVQRPSEPRSLFFLLVSIPLQTLVPPFSLPSACHEPWPPNSRSTVSQRSLECLADLGFDHFLLPSPSCQNHPHIQRHLRVRFDLTIPAALHDVDSCLSQMGVFHHPRL